MLEGLAAIHVHAPHVAIQISRDRTAQGSKNCTLAKHTVILNQVAFVDDEIVISSDSHELREAYCDCKVFSFRPADEAYCKHIVIAAVAVSLALAPVTHMAEAQFLSLLSVSKFEQQENALAT